MGGQFFTNDRLVKYGFGLFRLSAVVLYAFSSLLVTNTEQKGNVPVFSSWTLHEYLWSLRWLGHAYIGSIGAFVNVEQGGLALNLALLAGAAVACFVDSSYDYSILIYLLKTFGGDFIAGKLDTFEWKIVLLFTFFLFLPLLYALEPQSVAFVHVYSRILPLLFAIQVVCEYADAHYEQYLLIRHRYTFEILNVILLFTLSSHGDLQPTELRVVQVDLVICLFYRLGNLIIILSKQLSNVVNMICLRLLGFVTGVPFLRVTDPELATAILRNCSNKGKGLEYHIACNAWRPVLSLESVDGELWKVMRSDFDKLLKYLNARDAMSSFTNAPTTSSSSSSSLSESSSSLQVPENCCCSCSSDEKNEFEPLMPPTVSVLPSAGEQFTMVAIKIGAITSRKIAEMFVRLSPSGVVDADALVRLSVEIFIAYVFQRSWEIEFECFVDASWEWRKEISVRGVGDMDKKNKAVRILIDSLLRKSKLWDLFGELWEDPRYYSLILQPFLISPAINIGDIMCSVAINGPSCSYNLDQCMRLMHPFPVFERFMEKDMQFKGSFIPAGTHVIMFTSDFSTHQNKFSWPIFGAGARACLGAHIASPVLKALVVEVASRKSQFLPMSGHKFSGRHLDGVASNFDETIHFIRTVATALIRAWSEDKESLWYKFSSTA